MVPNIEKCEAAFRDAVNAINTSVNDLVRAIVQATDELMKLWKAEGAPGASALAWATAEANKDLSQLWANLTLIGSLLQNYQDVGTTLTALDLALAEQHTALQALEATQARQQKVEAQAVQQTARLLSLLRDAEAYIAARNR